MSNLLALNKEMFTLRTSLKTVRADYNSQIMSSIQRFDNIGRTDSMPNGHIKMNSYRREYADSVLLLRAFLFRFTSHFICIAGRCNRSRLSQ